MIFNIIICLILLVGMIFLIFYKRDMLIKMFSNDISVSANQFQQQLEETADIVVKRLEEQIMHLEYLLEEANQKMTSLDQKNQESNEIIAKENCLQEKISHSEKLLEEVNQKNQVCNEILSKGEQLKKQFSHLEYLLNEANEKVSTNNTIADSVLEEPKIIESNETPELSVDHHRDRGRQDKRNSIIAMADLGYDMSEIAKETGVSQGEIILLLQLNRK